MIKKLSLYLVNKKSYFIKIPWQIYGDTITTHTLLKKYLFVTLSTIILSARSDLKTLKKIVELGSEC